MATEKHPREGRRKTVLETQLDSQTSRRTVSEDEKAFIESAQRKSEQQPGLAGYPPEQPQPDSR